ncbi:hypothetical protein SRABI76_03040 [Microbacterium oxydans]|uniref:Uncharacterized protein n=1 Tax=Microbacterium oxydans TaxID=82380 RepID=A0A0F0L3N1_9MICO|nr:DUF6510 family protein [Microbacterium oxydans]KJL27757.1 hypothetical protein RS83_02811 [Microbacterium oxydans]CAH0242584.1 hypothetical protein SRABI76_03040 [Microbacterium oxydans]
MNATHPGHHTSVDGNAAGGVLLEIFGRDMTAALATCRHCEHEAALADAVAEMDQAGVILLCRGCRHTLLTSLASEGERTLDIGGLSRLRWSSEPLSTASVHGAARSRLHDHAGTTTIGDRGERHR